MSNKTKNKGGRKKGESLYKTIVKFRNYEARWDGMNWRLVRKGKNPETGEEVETFLGYYMTPGAFMHAIVKDCAHTKKKVYEIKDYLETYKEMKTDLLDNHKTFEQ